MEHQGVVDAVDGEVVRCDTELGAFVVIAPVARDHGIQQHLQSGQCHTAPNHSYSLRALYRPYDD